MSLPIYLSQKRILLYEHKEGLEVGLRRVRRDLVVAKESLRQVPHCVIPIVVAPVRDDERLLHAGVLAVPAPLHSQADLSSKTRPARARATAALPNPSLPLARESPSQEAVRTMSGFSHKAVEASSVGDREACDSIVGP